jgi:oligopeptidase B
MPTFPIAPKRPHRITQHGQTRTDDYFWIRYRDDPAVLEYLAAENDYLDEIMAHTKPIQEQLYQEMKARLKEHDSTVPEQFKDYFYYTKTEAGKQYPSYYRRRNTIDAPEELLLDQNALAEGKGFCRIGAFAISPDQQKLAFSVDPDGSEKCILYIKDLASGSLYPEQIPNTFGDVYDHTGVAWANDSVTLFYLIQDEALRPYKLYRHILREDPARDELVYQEADETYFLFVYKTRSQAYITVYSRSTVTSEWRTLLADQPLVEPVLFAERRRGIEYLIEHLDERFYVLTNQDAQNFKLMQTGLGNTSPENWVEVLPNRIDTLIESVEAFQNNLVLFERKNGLKQVRISGVDGLSDVRYVPFPEPVYNVTPCANPGFNTNLVRFTYSSLITPNSVIDFHMDNGQWELKKQDEIPSGHDPAQFVSERLYASAQDGAQVPLSIVYKRGLVKDGQNPTLLHGYGAYGSSVDASFNANRFSLIERGFIFAIAHVRGGSELGRAWYENGRMLHKRNSFTDFIACAEHLISQGYTTKGKLAIIGVSAGGLLAGACMTMRPDLFKAVIAKVPFVDVINTMSDPTIPLTSLEYDQWGNPDERVYFDYMLSYSPYDNIRLTAYPDVLITAGLNDPRVAYWEPAKFTARLRSQGQPGGLILLKTNMEAGHAGASGRYDYLKEIALEYAFLIERLGCR